MARFGSWQGFTTKICLVLAIISTIRAEPSGHGHSQQCPDVKFLPSTPTPSKCISSHHCSKVECVAASEGHKLTAIFKIHRCEQPMTATVTLEQPESSLNWSHTFRDGEKAKLPTMPSSFSGGLQVSDADLFVQVKLRKTQGNSVKFTVSIVGNVTVSEQVSPVDVVLMEGESPVSSVDCRMRNVTIEPLTEHSEKENYNPQENNYQENCPAVKLPEGSNCVLSEDCSKVTCTSPDSEDKGPFGHMVLTVQAYGCRQPLKATVTMESSLTPEKWSHTFEDGDKAALPMAPPGPVQMKVFLKVELKKNGDKVHFKLILLTESNAVSYNTTFLKGELHASKCDEKGGHDHSKQCPVVNFLPSDPTSGHKCSFSDHCSKVECVAASEGHKMTITFKLNQCHQPLTGTVSILLQSPGHIDWSHTLKDGEKAKLPATPSSFTGGLPVSDSDLFVQVKLRKTQGNNINFIVAIVGQVTDHDKAKPYPVNIVLLQGEVPASTKDCGSSASWFSRQSGGIKALVIIIPVTMVILLGLVVGLCCYRSRRDGLRFPVNIFPNRSKFGMQRLSNDI